MSHALFILLYIQFTRYISNSERGPLNQVMVHILPLVLGRCKQLIPDNSEESVTMQKQVSIILNVEL